MREIDGIPQALLTAFSSRRKQIEQGYQAALADYRRTHGHDTPRHVQSSSYTPTTGPGPQTALFPRTSSSGRGT